jgi:hypothetical protein
MHRHVKKIGPLIAAYAGALISSWAGMAYLPAIGPAPLRFLPALKPFTQSVPPLPAAAQPAPPPGEKAEKPSGPVAPSQPINVSPATGPTDTGAEPAPADGVISPQMLLKYFNKPTNSNAPNVKAPLDFIPPRTGEPRSSKAEYSTPSK